MTKPFSTELTTADLVVLSLVSERAMHGYELMREYEQQQVTEWASVSRPYVYYALQKLQRLQLTESLPTDPADRSHRDKTVYRITKAGRTALRQHLKRHSWSSAKAPAPFMTWFGLSIHLTERQRQRLLHSRAEFLTEEIRRKRKILNFIKTYPSPRATAGLPLVQLYVKQCQTELRWLKTLSPLSY